MNGAEHRLVPFFAVGRPYAWWIAGTVVFVYIGAQ